MNPLKPPFTFIDCTKRSSAEEMTENNWGFASAQLLYEQEQDPSGKWVVKQGARYDRTKLLPLLEQLAALGFGSDRRTVFTLDSEGAPLQSLARGERWAVADHHAMIDDIERVLGPFTLTSIYNVPLAGGWNPQTQKQWISRNRGVLPVARRLGCLQPALYWPIDEPLQGWNERTGLTLREIWHRMSPHQIIMPFISPNGHERSGVFSVPVFISMVSALRYGLYPANGAAVWGNPETDRALVQEYIQAASVSMPS